MRLLNHGIAFATLVACLNSFAHAEPLQWVQSSPARATHQTVARPTSTLRPAAQPTFRQPGQFKQPTRARVTPSPQRIAKQPTFGEPRAKRTASTADRRIAERTRVGVLPAQHTEVEELPPATTTPAPAVTEYYSNEPAGEPMMMTGPMMPGPMVHGPTVMHEPYCGAPEPTCGCVGPCGCGDACYLGDPGCGVGDVCFGEATCAAAVCGDACCGDACCDPGCGCGTGCGDVCYDDTITWPEALFGFESRGCTPILWIPPLKEWTLFAGVQGHKGPLDNGRDGGNFGFHQGFNLGGKMAWIPWPGLGYQFGYRATQNQLHGDASSGSDDSHSQHFITTGLFMRNCYGWRYGVVWDMLRDERQTSHDFGQVRGQIGWRNAHCREFGFQFATHSNDSQVGNPQVGTTLYQTADQYLLYYQIYGRQGGDARAYAGFSGDSNGILGTDFHVPLSPKWSLAGSWTYLVAEGGVDGAGAQEEAWNLGMSLVWHYGCRAKQWSNRPFRPMFDVADNGSLIVTR